MSTALLDYPFVCLAEASHAGAACARFRALSADAPQIRPSARSPDPLKRTRPDGALARAEGEKLRVTFQDDDAAASESGDDAAPAMSELPSESTDEIQPASEEGGSGLPRKSVDDIQPAPEEGGSPLHDQPPEDDSTDRPTERAPYDSPEDLRLAAGCAVVTFAVYMKTLYPHVPGGDAGELIAAAHQLGVAHPPGYPLFILYEKLFALLLFFGSVAWRMNVGMAFAGAAAAGVIFLTAAHLVNERGAALLAAGLFALNPIVWTYSTQAEVPPPTPTAPPPCELPHARTAPLCAGVPAQQLACRGAALPRRALPAHPRPAHRCVGRLRHGPRPHQPGEPAPCRRPAHLPPAGARA